jgi:hypothetical protein
VASRIAAVTASGSGTLIACDAPASSWLAWAPARLARNRCSATGMFLSWSPKTNDDGRCRHGGVSAVRASSVPSAFAEDVDGLLGSPSDTPQRERANAYRRPRAHAARRTLSEHRGARTAVLHSPRVSLAAMNVA